MSLSNQKCIIQPTLTNLHPNGYSQEFHYCSFAVKVVTSDVSCNTLNYSSNKVYFPNKTEDLNRRVFVMIAIINEMKILTKHRSCECKCNFDGKKNVIQISGGITINVNVSVKNIMYVKKIIFRIWLHVVVNWKILKKQKLLQQVLMKKSNLQNATSLYSTCIFMDYYSIIDSCKYFLLFW